MDPLAMSSYPSSSSSSKKMKKRKRNSLRNRQRCRGWSCLAICFVGSPVCKPVEPAEKPPVGSSKKVSWLRWLRSWRRKKTVPMVLYNPAEIGGETTGVGGAPEGSPAEVVAAAGRRRISDKVRKTRTSQRATNPPPIRQPDQGIRPIENRHVSTRDHPPKDLPTSRSHDATSDRNLRTSRSGSSKPDRPTNKAPQRTTKQPAATPEFVVHRCGGGLWVVVMGALALVVVLGRLGAIAALTWCFYASPAVQPAVHKLTNGGGGGGTGTDVIDVESKERKKRVVLEGFLERNGRRPSPA